MTVHRLQESDSTQYHTSTFHPDKEYPSARGTRSEIMAKIQEKNPLFSEVLPLTLEEIFISETEVAGYEIQNIFF